MRTQSNSDRARRGFTLVEVMIVVGIVALLTIIAIPNFLRYRTTSQKNVCIANLKQMQSAKVQWACEYRKTSTDTPVDTDIFGANNYLRAKPYCPIGDADYMTTIGQVDQMAQCPHGTTQGHTL